VAHRASIQRKANFTSTSMVTQLPTGFGERRPWCCRRTHKRDGFELPAVVISAQHSTRPAAAVESGLHRSDPAHPPGDARRESGRRGRSPSKPAGRGDTVICASVLPKRQLRPKARPHRSLAKRAAALRSRTMVVDRADTQEHPRSGRFERIDFQGKPSEAQRDDFPCWRCWTPCGRYRQTASGG